MAVAFWVAVGPRPCVLCNTRRTRLPQITGVVAATSVNVCLCVTSIFFYAPVQITVITSSLPRLRSTSSSSSFVQTPIFLAIIRLPFELWSLAVIVINIIIITPLSHTHLVALQQQLQQRHTAVGGTIEVQSIHSWSHNSSELQSEHRHLSSKYCFCVSKSIAVTRYLLQCNYLARNT